MARKAAAADQFTPVELELMQVLWEKGASTVQMVLEALPASRALAYTSVQTMLGVLHRKKKVKREYRNRAYWYEAAVTRDGAAGSAIRDIVDRLFGGAPERLVMAMVEADQLDQGKLEELQRAFETALEKKREA